MQARHVTASIKETYALFCEEYSEFNVGKSKFAECRPKHVQLSRKLPHNVCMCRHHENAINAFNAVHKALPEFPAYSHDLLETFLSKEASRNCWLNKCPDCKDTAGFTKAYSFDGFLNTPCSWLLWEADQDGRMMKIQEDGTLAELVEHICDILPQFLQHCYVKREQAAACNSQRESVASEYHDVKKALLQVDFSENYTCVSQDEVQSAHWNQRQVSLFTAALWHSGSLHSHVVASDNLTHSKDTIGAYMDFLLDGLPKNVVSVSVWSDGPASLFKNRFIGSAISALQNKHSINIDWNFFCTSHGKGPVDGIGGSVKRFVWNQVLTRQYLVTNAETFVAAASTMENVTVREIKSDEIEKRNGALNLEAAFNKAEAIPFITKMHLLKVVNGVVVAQVLTKDEAPENPVNPTSDESICIGDWYIVEYEGQQFPGEVIDIREGEYQVSVMERAGKNWKWPSTKDNIFYMKSKMISKLEAPEVVNSRAHFKFSVHI
ncbi:uncharacterized protein LOC117121731 [Anneissia japonica]|uniref:uncharacterized protein LOC117121731 n=1 Tax=Anneissia japonica TaxID=1529436 RepID=UPI001425646A|nr:uncharacterized protein LOC117121731 [Anneissia japonica]